MSSLESYFQSSSSTSSFQRNTADSSDSMSTPTKPRANSGQTFNAEDMKAVLKADLDDHVHNNISVDLFVENVWGLSHKSVQSILHASFDLREESLSQYKDVFARKSQLREPDLHKPFREISRGLLQDVCKLLSVEHTKLDTYFWDGYGDVYIHHDPQSTSDSKRKPDLLEVYIPVAADHEATVNPDDPLSLDKLPAPTWPLVRAPLEFKKKRAGASRAGTNLESIKEDDEAPSTSARSSRVRSRGGRTSTKNSDASSVGTKDSRRTGRKRSGSPSLSDTHKNQKRSKTNNISSGELQLAYYALECLYAGNRHYVTGIFIDTFNVTLWYFDRSAAMRTVAFDFQTSLGTKQLALALFALSRCDMTQAGFDPHIYRFTGNVDQPVEDSMVTPLSRPLFASGEVCYKFPSQKNGDNPIFVLENLVSRYRGINGRGTIIADVLRGLEGKTLENSLSVLKLSWQYKTRTHEGEIISRLREVIPEWQNHLPDPLFYTTISAEDFDMPMLRVYKALKEQGIEILDHPERDLHAFVTNRYKPIWKARNIEEFKQIFLDCVECHFHTYKKGRVLHRDISDNNLMIYQPGETDKTDSASEAAESNDHIYGILNDFDMAAALGEDDQLVSANPNHHHITGTLPFMACDLLSPDKQYFEEHNPNLPKAHLYRYDLESFLYVLIFAASSYNLVKGRRGSIPRESPLRNWLSSDQRQAYNAKMVLFTSRGDKSIARHIRPEWADLWDLWVVPLCQMFGDAFHEASRKETDYDFITLGGRLTFEKFMKAIGEKPRPS